MLLDEKNKHCRDWRIKFNPQLHEYSIDGNENYISVTTLIKEFFVKFDENIVIQKIKSLENSKYYGMTKEQIQKKWKISQELGILLHDTIEHFYNELNCNIPNEIDTEFAQFLNFNSTLKWKVFRTEWCIFDENFKIAGTVDVTFYDPSTGKYHIMDWKRTSKMPKMNPYSHGKPPLNCLDDCKFNHYSLQLNIYKYILEKKYGLSIESMTIVIFHPDHVNYIIEKVDDHQELVKQLLNNYHSIH